GRLVPDGHGRDGGRRPAAAGSRAPGTPHRGRERDARGPVRQLPCRHRDDRRALRGLHQAGPPADAGRGRAGAGRQGRLAERRRGPPTSAPGVASYPEVLDVSCVEHLDLRTTHRHLPHHVPRPGAFWLVGLAFVILLFGVTLPTPLYVVYQAKW